MADRNHLPGTAHACDCRGAICGESPLGPLLYRCAGCRRLFPWCYGAADNMPEHCDECWLSAESRRG